jgi:outer membrane lipoprotein-sorting protein
MPMRNTITSLALLCAAILPLATAAKPVSSATCKGSFTATIKPAEQPKGSGQGLQMPSFAITGTIYWAKPRMRVDMAESNSGERMRLQTDVETGESLMLYPDTLNGTKGKLRDFDQTGYYEHFSEMVRQGGIPAPKGWKREKSGTEKVGAKDCTKYTLTSPKGNKVLWWGDKDDLPIRMRAANHGVVVQVDFQSLKYGVDVPDAVFTVEKEYSISTPAKGTGDN